jgi:hypothetical protein
MPEEAQSNTYSIIGSYTYPQFVIDERTGQVCEVNLIDNESGQVVFHIPSAELQAIVRDHFLLRETKTANWNRQL